MYLHIPSTYRVRKKVYFEALMLLLKEDACTLSVKFWIFASSVETFDNKFMRVHACLTTNSKSIVGIEIWRQAPLALFPSLFVGIPFPPLYLFFLAHWIFKERKMFYEGKMIFVSALWDHIANVYYAFYFIYFTLIDSLFIPITWIIDNEIKRNKMTPTTSSSFTF